jgi:hypothetical protein
LAKITEEGNPNSRVGETDNAIRSSDRVDFIVIIVGNILTPLIGEVKWKTRLAPVFTLAHVNDAQFAFLDRGSGDTDDCNGEEGHEELSGRQHRH